MIKSATTGAVIGAVTGGLVGVGYHAKSLLSTSNNERQAEKDEYEYIDRNNEISFHAREIELFKSHAPEEVRVFMDSLDRLMAIEELSSVVSKDALDVGWPITAQYLAREVSDALLVIKTKIKDQTQKMTLEVHMEEIKTHLGNTLYNIDMNVQQKINE